MEKAAQKKAANNIVLFPAALNPDSLDRLKKNVDVDVLRVQRADLMASIVRETNLVHEECLLGDDDALATFNPEIKKALEVLSEAAQALKTYAQALCERIDRDQS